MQKKATDTIGVSVTRLGSDPIAVTLPKDATVRQALEAAGVALGANDEYFVDGIKADFDDILDDRDVLAIVTPKQAGA